MTKKLTAAMQPIKTQYGFLHGRDCIHLDEYHFDDTKKRAIFKGEICGDLCSEPQPNKWISYQLSLLGVEKIDRTELDVWISTCDLQSISSFDVIVSPNPHALFNNTSGQNKHLLISTYDHVFEVICSDFTMTFGDVRD